MYNNPNFRHVNYFHKINKEHHHDYMDAARQIAQASAYTHLEKPHVVWYHDAEKISRGTSQVPRWGQQTLPYQDCMIAMNIYLVPSLSAEIERPIIMAQYDKLS